MLDHSTRRMFLAGLGGMMSTTLAGCAELAPESQLRPVSLGLRNERANPVQATLRFETFPTMVVPEADNEATWTVTAPAKTEVFEDHQGQPATYTPQIEVKRLGDDIVLHADQHEVRVPEPRGSRTTVEIIVTPTDVRIDILPHIGA